MYEYASQLNFDQLNNVINVFLLHYNRLAHKVFHLMLYYSGNIQYTHGWCVAILTELECL